MLVLDKEKNYISRNIFLPVSYKEIVAQILESVAPKEDSGMD